MKRVGHECARIEDGERDTRFAKSSLAFVMPFANVVFVGFAVTTHGREFDDVANANGFGGLREICLVKAGARAGGEREKFVDVSNGFSERSWIFEIAAHDFNAGIEFGFDGIAGHSADFFACGEELSDYFATDGAGRSCYENH